MRGAGVGYVKYHNHKDLLQRLADFMTHAHMTYVNQGSDGVTFKCVTKGRSPYVNMDTGERVSAVLIKLVSLSGSIVVKGEKYALESTSRAEFENEVAMQHRVFNESTHICPSILVSAVLTGAEVNAAMARNVTNAGSEIGLIVMEIVEDAVSLYHTSSAHDEAVARAKFIYMGLKGVNHGDFHRGNVLSAHGKVYVIDFGRASLLPPKLIKLIQKSVREKDYVQALRVLVLNSSIPGKINEFVNKQAMRACARQGWVNNPIVNDTIEQMVRAARKKKCGSGPCHFMQYYDDYFGWVFSDALLNLTAAAKTGIDQQLRALVRLSPAKASTVKHNRGSSFESFGSSDTLNSASGGRTRGRKQRS